MHLRIPQRSLVRGIALVLLLGDTHSAISGTMPTRPGSVIAVSTCNDDGPGSLRAAIAAAADGDVIDLQQLACSTISLTGGALDVQVPHLRIVGPGADKLAIDAGLDSRVMVGAVDLILRGVALRNGRAEGDGGCIEAAGPVTLNDVVVEGCAASAVGEARGGGVHVAGVLTLRHSRISGCSVHSETGDALGGGAAADGGANVLFSTLSGNTASSNGSTSYRGRGGGIRVGAASVIAASTFEGNHADFAGGLMLDAPASDTTQLLESTISGNVADKVGGVASGAGLTIRNSTIAFNCAVTTRQGKYAAGIGLNGPTGRTITSEGALIANNTLCPGASGTPYDVGGFGTGFGFSSHNLVQNAPEEFLLPSDTLRADPKLRPLADNGGPTRTHAFAVGSPAIDAGDVSSESRFDQRGDGASIGGAMSDADGSGPRDPRDAAWTSRIVGPRWDIGAYEVQSSGTRWTVTQCGDEGDGSLRAAVEAAASGDRIDLAAAPCATILLKTPVVVTVGNLEIEGPGASRLTIATDDPVGHPHRLIMHAGAGALTLRGLTLATGADVETGDAGAYGGCVTSSSFVRGSDLVFQSCHASAVAGECSGGALSARGAQFERTIFDVASCETSAGSGSGGAIDSPLLSLIDSRVSRGYADGNAASANLGKLETPVGSVGLGVAGCIRSTARARLERTTVDACESGFNAAGAFASLDLLDSTVTGNHATSMVGGLYAEDAVLANSTIASNTHSGVEGAWADGVHTTSWARIDSTIIYGNGGAQGDLDGAAIAGAHNLIGSSSIELPPDTLTDDPHLGPLADNGGNVPTLALAPGSIAVNAGSNPLGLSSDARGNTFARVVGPAPDIGAYEIQEATDAIFGNGFDPATRADDAQRLEGSF